MELQRIVSQLGSWKRTSELLGLSTQDLKQLRELHPEVSTLQLEGWDADRFTSELRRLKSVKIFSLVHGCPISEIHSKSRKLGIDIRTSIEPIGSTSGTGRKGELFFKEKMSSLIREDAFETQGHTAPYDFVCNQPLGLVNVKTANRDRYTAKCRASNPNFWDFSTKGMRDCDTLALVPLDPRGEPMQIVLVKTADLKDSDTHIILTGKDLKATSECLLDYDPTCSMRKIYILLPRNILSTHSLSGGRK